MAYTSRPHASLLGLMAGLGLLAGCGDDGGTPDAGTTTPPADAAVEADMGSADPDVGPADTGVPGACNPVDGTGCPSEEFCVLTFRTGEGQCRTLPDQKAFGATCDPALQDCGPGLSCLQLVGETEPTCRQTCRQGGSECASVPDMSQVYSCAFTNEVMDPQYGACIGSGGASCNPLDMLSCPMGDVCSVVPNTVDTACATAGMTALGSSCGMSNCASGQGICMNFTGDPLCYEACNPAQPVCSQPNYRCIQPSFMMMNFAFGVCLPPAAGACNPFNNPCPMGQVCSTNADANGVECVPVGTVPLGSDCSAGNCTEGLFCTPIEGGGRLCLEPCDLLGTPMCPMGQSCQSFGLDFGVCGN